MAGRRKVCVWLDEELYEAVISIATSRAKRVGGLFRSSYSRL